MTPSAPLSFAVLGPGGVGGLLAGLLSRAGDDVTCLAGASTVAALRSAGLQVQSGRFGTFRVPTIAAERLEQPVDVCLVTVKATQLDTALERVPAEVLGNALMVPLLNGVEHVALLRSRYPRARVAAAAIRIESTRTGPGQVQHDSPFATVELCAGPGVQPLADRLSAAGLDVTVRENEREVLWGKLGFLAPLALLTTHAGAPVGVVRESRREELLAVVHEVAAVARAEGATGDPGPVTAALDALPPTMRSSMQRDAEAGRPLELDALGGAVLRAAGRHGLELPVTARLVSELQARNR